MPVNQYIYPPVAQVVGLPIFLIGIGGSQYQAHISRPEGYCWHQILYCADGKGELKIGDDVISLSQGWYFLLPAGVPHEYYPVDGDWDVRWVVFDGFACLKTMAELKISEPIYFKPDKNDELCSI